MGFLRATALLSTALLALGLFGSGVEGAAKEACAPSETRNVTLKIADNDQCDKYYECGKSGKMIERLCDDGFQFAEETHQCDYPHNVKCGTRKNLQPSQSLDPKCPRLNGFYPFPPAESCAKFYHCLEGKPYEKTCPDAVIFDPLQGTCVHPDLSRRQDCSASAIHNFNCPVRNGRKQKFGDHDRLAHPTDCRRFYICLADGSPRLGSCPYKTVFNGAAGICDKPSKVPECKDYYNGRAKEEGDEDSSEEESSEPMQTNTLIKESPQSPQGRPKLGFKSKRSMPSYPLVY